MRFGDQLCPLSEVPLYIKYLKDCKISIRINIFLTNTSNSKRQTMAYIIVFSNPKWDISCIKRQGIQYIRSWKPVKVSHNFPPRTYFYPFSLFSMNNFRLASTLHARKGNSMRDKSILYDITAPLFSPLYPSKR